MTKTLTPAQKKVIAIKGGKPLYAKEKGTPNLGKGDLNTFGGAKWNQGKKFTI